MALVQEKTRPQPRRHHRPPRMEMRSVIDMTQVDGDPGSAGTATTSEEEYGVTDGDDSQRQVFPEDFLHALATLETFRHLAAAGIDNELGLEAGTIRHLARLDARQEYCKSENIKQQRRVNDSTHRRRDSGAVSDIEENLDGKVPARAKFSSEDVMFDIKVQPLADFLETLTHPDHLQKVKEILDKASTPFDYYRIDERINESYRSPNATANAAMSWLASNFGTKREVPNVPIVRELRIDIKTLHPSAIYRLEQFRRRQLKARVLPMRMDEFVEEKEPEWIKQRTREKRLARKIQQEKERIRQLEEEAREKKRLAEEKEREHAATVRRHLRMNSVARRGRRHSDDSSEMSPVPSNVSSPSPPPPQFFHEVQESVPFPFGPASLIPQPNQQPKVQSIGSSPLSSLRSPEDLRNKLSPRRARHSILPPASTQDTATAPLPIKPLPRLKIKFKGASLTVDKDIDKSKDDRLSTHTATPVSAASWATIIGGSKSVPVADAGRTDKGTPKVSGESTLETQNKVKALASTAVQNSKDVPQSPRSAVIDVDMEVETVPTKDSARPLSAGAPSSGSGEQHRAPSVPRATQQAISQMETALTERGSIGPQRQGVADVDIAIDVTVEAEIATSVTNALGASLGPPRALMVQTVGTQSDMKVNRSQDEEDEALVEELGGLDALSRDDSSGKGSARINGDFPLSSAGFLRKGKVPDRFPEITSDEGRVATAAVPTNQHVGISSTTISSTSVETPDPVDPGFEMVIDDELEPVSMRDTHSESWKQVLKSARSASAKSGSERSSYSKGKGKGKANELSIHIRSPDREDSDDNARWAHSAKVIQIRGITGPTATDTDSPSIDSPDTTSLSPPLVPSPTVAPAAVQVVTIHSDTTSGPTSTTPISSASLERRRQNEALYAALAANFLTRCGSTTQARTLYDPKATSQPSRDSQPVWHRESASSSRTSETPPAFSSLQQRTRMTTCDPRQVFGGTGVKKEDGDDIAEKVEAPESDPRESNEERLSDDEAMTLQADDADAESPVEALHEVLVPVPVADGSLTSPYEIDDDDSEVEDQDTARQTQGRAQRNKRKTYDEMISIEDLDLSPHERRRTGGKSRGSSIPVFDEEEESDVEEEEDYDSEPEFLSGRNPWTDPTDLEVVIPIRRNPFSPPVPAPVAGPNLKIILNLGPYRQ